MGKRWFAILLVTTSLLQIPLCAWRSPVVQAFTAQNLIYGSQGYDVYELQNRLSFVGYYHSKVDGNFGWKTYWAVRNFQHSFGMPITGVVNLQTKQRLVAASRAWHYKPPSSSSPQSSTPIASVPGVSQSDVSLLAHVVYGEARGEPFSGEVAIAAVILNRLTDPKFPHNIPAIVYQPGAFTAVQDGQINLAPDSTAKRAVIDAIHGVDPSHGAIYYFNPATATNKWIWSRPEIVKIGKHIFCS